MLEFLNAREKAAVLWALAILGFCLVKGDGLAGQLVATIRTLFGWKLLLAFGSAALYAGLLLWLADELGLWHLTAAKASAYWFFGTGVVLIATAIQSSPDEPISWGKFVHKGLKFAILADFVINLYVLPFAVEFFLVPLIVVFVAVLAMKPENPVVLGILLVINLSLLAYVTERVIADPSAFFARETAEDFLVAPALSLAVLPLLGVIAWYSRWELLQLRKRWPSFVG